jgi:hypothetical protein
MTDLLGSVLRGYVLYTNLYARRLSLARFSLNAYSIPISDLPDFFLNVSLFLNMPDNLRYRKKALFRSPEKLYES